MFYFCGSSENSFMLNIELSVFFYFSELTQLWLKNWLDKNEAACCDKNSYFCITYYFIGAFFSSVSLSLAVSTNETSHLSLLGSLILFLAFLNSVPNSFSSSSSSPHLYPFLAGPLLTEFSKSGLLDLANRLRCVDFYTSLFLVEGGTLGISSFLAPELAFEEATFSSKVWFIFSCISFGWYFAWNSS